MKRVLALLTLGMAFVPAALAKAKTGARPVRKTRAAPRGRSKRLGTSSTTRALRPPDCLDFAVREGLKDGHLGVTSFRGVVLLTGQVRDEESKALASEVLSGIEDVKSVYNELTISGPTALLARSADALVTRSRLDLSPARMCEALKSKS